MNKQKYITRNKHLNYPAGTECLARYLNMGRELELEFNDGTIINLTRSQFYLEGFAG
jgi:hypothetical protein